MSEGSSAHGAVDPLILQAEKILSQRLARNQVIDPDILGEPGWDILLSVFIENGKGKPCRADLVAGELGLAPEIARRWFAELEQRSLVLADGNLLRLTDNANSTLRKLFSAQMQELMQEISQWAPGAGKAR